MTDRSCPGCGLVLPKRDGPTHAYLESSPECWALYGDLLAREFGDPEYFAIHQLTVDTYAVQHPGKPERRTVQSLALHLITLCLVLEDGLDPRRGPELHKRLVRSRSFHRLEPPAPNGRLTVADVVAARRPAEHAQAVRAWAGDVWNAWKAHHETVRQWAQQAT